MEIFDIKDLSFRYPEGEQSVLNNINLKINKGEILTICGASGCGKTTLIKHLKTPLTPHGEKQGEVLFEGKRIEQVDFRVQSEKIGYVLQSPEDQIVTDKVWHELAFGLESLGYNNQEIRLRVAETANYFGIQDWFYKETSELSGGQKQMLNLASVMAMNPEVLILDEPTSQLDPINAVEFLETLKKINNDLGVTIIITEHRLEEILPLSDRVLVMDCGEITVLDTPKNTCKKLKQLEHEMFCAMPASVRIYGGVDSDIMPLTTGEGREYMLRFFEDRTLHYIRVEKEVSETPKEVVIEARQVSFRYERHGKDILQHMGLKVNKGELYAMVGGNGSGKTTTLNILSKIYKPYTGKVKVKGKVATLPQNPRSLFVKTTVLEELQDMFKRNQLHKYKIDEIAKLTRINQLFDKHPFDLSGGEQQRVALAKVLLAQPDILLLDEPTKGLDANFKQKLAKVLKDIIATGVTIVMVSHDIEFCASYADRCGMFFCGSIVSENDTNTFFSSNNFYTTTGNKMSRSIFENAVTAEDVIELWKQNQNYLNELA